MGQRSTSNFCRPQQTHRGGCDCGAVRYELQVDAILDAAFGMDSLIRARDFRLLSGEDTLTGHQFGTHDVEHFYCERCGVRSFLRERSASYAVQLLRLDMPEAVLSC